MTPFDSLLPYVRKVPSGRITISKHICNLDWKAFAETQVLPSKAQFPEYLQTGHVHNPTTNTTFHPLTLPSNSTTMSLSFVAEFIYEQLFLSLPYPQTSFSGQKIIVTGSNVGLGFEAALHFTRLSAAKVVLAVRNLEKGEAAKKAIEESTKRTGVVEVWQLDLSSYESVKQFVKRAEGLDRLDAIVENAGIATEKYQVFEDNESTITINVVSTFLLALMILPKLRETARKFNVTPRLSIVSSEVHGFTSFPEKSSADIFKTLNDKETANMPDR